MGVQVEFNDCLALRNIKEWQQGKREKEECIPDKLKSGKKYKFLKQGLRVYNLQKPIELRETKGKQKTSEPLAQVKILDATHFLLEGQPFTQGSYQVTKIL